MGAGRRFRAGRSRRSALDDPDGCAAVVDLLSLTTAVSVAVGRGTEVVPFRFGDMDAEGFVAGPSAGRALARDQVSAEHPWSLSPVDPAAAPVGRRPPWVDAAGLDEIVATTVPANRRSWRVMERLGMHREEIGNLEHPSVPDGHPLRRQVLYRLRASTWRSDRHV
jgi:hypothetical protein